MTDQEKEIWNLKIQVGTLEGATRGLERVVASALEEIRIIERELINKTNKKKGRTESNFSSGSDVD